MMLEIREALDRILANFEALEAEELPLVDAQNRFLAVDVLAEQDAPPFSNSAMDGYAVRAADVANADATAPIPLPVSGESRAGSSPDLTLRPGSAMRIFTGAPLPAGADAIVMQEDTERSGDEVRIAFASPVGHHIRARGEDTRRGDVLLPRASALTPGAIGLLASQGIGRVRVHRRPKVAIVSTGDELRSLDAAPEPGTIVDSNRYALAAQIREAGGEPWALPPVGDDLEATVARLSEALSADVVLSTGGVSVGDHDHVRDALTRVGIVADFWKVRIKPGKPVTFGLQGATPFVGLPGNPVSAMVTFHVFVLPGLRKMLGDPQPHPAPLRVRLGHDLRRKPGRPELARARLEQTEGGPTATLARSQGSGALPSVAFADVLVLLPAEAGDLKAGQELLALPFGRPPGSAESLF